MKRLASMLAQVAAFAALVVRSFVMNEDSQPPVDGDTKNIIRTSHASNRTWLIRRGLSVGEGLYV
jgi:hypothetical protein